jgi:hypothetical protein
MRRLDLIENDAIQNLNQRRLRLMRKAKAKTKAPCCKAEEGVATQPCAEKMTDELRVCHRAKGVKWDLFKCIDGDYPYVLTDGRTFIFERELKHIEDLIEAKRALDEANGIKAVLATLHEEEGVPF